MKRTILLTMLLLLAFVTAASATTIVMNFTAADFYEFPPLDAHTPPVDPVTGSITWKAASVNSPITSLTSINLAIGGHTYSLDDIAFDTYIPDIAYSIIGGKVSSVDGISSIAGDDFAIMWEIASLTPTVFAYATTGINEIFETRQFTDFSIEVSPVPEPTSMFLLGTGLVGVALAARRKKKNQA